MDKNNIIKNRESWAKIAIAVFVTLIFGWNITFGSWNILSSDALPQILSLLLALFSIGLSVVFYFKAVETSNTFYDRTYNFTSRLSEMLGRIEAGFGKQLEIIEQKSSAIFDTTSALRQSIRDADKEQEQSEKRKYEVENEKNAIINDLLEKCHIHETQKKEVLMELEQKDKQIHILRAQAEREKTIALVKRFSIVQTFIKGAFSKLFDCNDIENYDTYKEKFYAYYNRIPHEIILDLKHLEWVDNDNNLTETGLKEISKILDNSIVPF